MPRLELTFPAGALTDEAKSSLPATMAETMLKWEGAPDNDFFRSISWTHLHELPEGAMHTADGPMSPDEPQFIVDVSVPAGALSERRRGGLVEELTANVRDAAGVPEEGTFRIWVIVNEVPDGFWGSGGAIVRFQELADAAKAAREEGVEKVTTG